MDEKLFTRTLQRVVEALEESGVPYHLTGGLASIFYGEPRFTQDLDFVIQIDLEEGRKLTRLLSKNFYIEEDTVLEAIKRNSMFQPLDKETFLKVDFHVGGDIPGEFGRSVTREIFSGVSLKVVSKEDAILSKLRWIALGSGKSEKDVIGMLLNEKPFDERLVQSVAERMGWKEIWHRLEKTAEEKKKEA